MTGTGNLVSANRMVMPLLEGIPGATAGPALQHPAACPFHPEGAGRRATVNLAEWSSHLLERLHRQLARPPPDPELIIKLYQELKAYPMPGAVRRRCRPDKRRDTLQDAASHGDVPELYFHHD